MQLPALAVADGGESPPRTARRLHLAHDCNDRRFPRLAGTSLVHCGVDGTPTRVLDLASGERFRLDLPATATAHSPGLGPEGTYVAIGAGGGVWDLPEDRPREGSVVRARAIGPAATDGIRVAFAEQDQIDVAALGTASRQVWPAHAAPWYAPAIAGPVVAWVEVTDGDADVWALLDEGEDPTLLAGGPGLQHHPVGSPTTLAWVDDGDVVIRDAGGHLTRVAAHAGFESAPTAWQDTVCWSDRAAWPPTVRCTDGWEAPGRFPSGGGPLVLARDELGWVLYCAAWWPLTADGGPVRVDDWWGSGSVEVQRLGPDGWVTEATVTGSDAIQLPPGPLRVVPTDPIPRGLR